MYDDKLIWSNCGCYFIGVMVDTTDISLLGQTHMKNTLI